MTYTTPMDIEQKWLPIPDCPPYEASDQGNIRNSATGKIRKLSQKAEYIQVRLLVNKKEVYRSVHKVVAELFVPRPADPSKKLVNHKNGNKKDNRAENLEWTNQSENRLHAINVLGKNKGCQRSVIQHDLENNEIRTFTSLTEAANELKLNSDKIGTACKKSEEYGGFNWKYKDEYKNISDFSGWKDIPANDKYLISPMGQIYSKFNKRLRKIQLTENGYQCVCLSENKKVVRKYVHILMAETFLIKPEGEGVFVVNHKDGNKSNNVISNLEWVTQSKNILDAVKAGKIVKKVIQCDPDTHDEIREYNSIQEAADDHNISRTGVSQVLTARQKTAAGFFWKYV